MVWMLLLLRKRILFPLMLIVCLSISPVSSHAGLLPVPADELQTFLKPQTLSIDGVRLSHDALNRFYAARAYAPAWPYRGTADDTDLSHLLGDLKTIIINNGLNPLRYPLAILEDMAQKGGEGARGKIELLLTTTLLLLCDDLYGKGTDLSNLYTGWTAERPERDLSTLLNNAIRDDKLLPFLASLVPSHPEYKALSETLKTYRDSADLLGGEWPSIADGPMLRLQDSTPRVGQLRARLAAEGYEAPVTNPEQRDTFDIGLETALKSYQTHNGLISDGHLGKKTLSSLNAPLEERIDQIRANMERWRHIPDPISSPDLISINIPSMTITIKRNGAIAYEGPVIVGRVDRKTPFVQSAVKSMILNPSWHVPAKIAREDILPKLRKDPHYLEKLGFVIKDHTDDPHGLTIDWTSLSKQQFNLQLRQAPGEQNSLGPIKFDFDNDFAVYMHGTPHTELFAENERAFSSGCIRLRDPALIGQILTASLASPWNQERITAAITTGTTKWVGLSPAIPITITYWTVFERDGHTQFRRDLYGYDKIIAP